jgi:NAD(P)-dependent dehydrogenase (short-subunit alcohol dehydrogenase family)
MDVDDYNELKPMKSHTEIFDLSGRAGIIIGGTGKMGQQFALALSNAGATVVIADVNSDKCEHVAKEITASTKGSALGMACDVTQEKRIKELFHEFANRFRQIDFLIYNVMAKPEGYYKSLDQYTVNTWDQVISGNLTGAFLCCREAGKLMLPNKSGSIVLTSSTYGIVGPDQRIYQHCDISKNIYAGSDPLNCPASYSASKAGLVGLAKHFATLWGEYRIRVNTFIPGGVFDGQEESFHEAYTTRVPLGRMAVCSDYNGAILFLVSDASRYMTGASLVLDGGWSAW